MHPDPTTFWVLLGDDSVDDRFFVKRSLSKMAQVSICGEMTDGDEVITYLLGKPPYDDRSLHPFPDMLLLDLKMPGKGGYEVLEWMKTASLPHLPVLVVSHSDLPEDKARCQELGAIACCPKSFNSFEEQEFVVQVRKWLQTPAPGTETG